MTSTDFDAANAELARRSLVAFGKRVEPAFTPARHVTFLCGLLEQLEMGTIKRLSVSMPPRFAKTTTASQLFPAWAIGRDSRRSVILANHSADLAAGFSRKCKGYIESPSWPFPKIELSEDSRAVHRWHVSGGGGLHAVGVGSGITGIGADLLVIDDPINDALSETERNLAWQWYQQVAFPRCNADARILVVSARLAMDDLPGRLQEADDASEWRFVSLPAINQPDNELGLEPGTPLWSRFNEKELAQRREAMGLAAFESQFMQNPSVAAGGRIFRLEDFGVWDKLPLPPAPSQYAHLDPYFNSPLQAARPDNSSFVKITACDFAGTENTSTGGSYSALVTIFLNVLSGECYVLDCERFRNLEFYDLRNNVAIHLSKHGPNLVVIESNDATGGRMIGDLSRSTHWPIRAVNPKTSKVERALQIIGMVESGKVLLPARSAWGDMLRNELAQFGLGCRYSDMADALVWALLAARQYVAARREDRFWNDQIREFSLFG